MGVTLVQFVGELYRQVDQRIRVVLPRPGYGVRQIRQEPKVNIAILVCQVAHFKFVE